MTFPSSGGSKQDSLADAWRAARDRARDLKLRSQQLKAQSEAGPIARQAVLDYATFLAEAKLVLTAAANTGGIGAYAQAQINDASINIATEFNAMMTGITNTVDWILDQFPRDANGFLLVKVWGTGAIANTGRTQDATFTTAQLANLRTQLDALIATID